MSARQALLDLAAGNGGAVTTDMVVAAAAPADSPLHPHFCWDDTEAAHRYRLVQAGELLRRYKIVREVEPDRFVRVRQFLNVPNDTGRAWEPTEDVMADDEKRPLVLEQCLRDIDALRAKYANLLDFDEALRQSIGRKVTRRKKAADTHA